MLVAIRHYLLRHAVDCLRMQEQDDQNDAVKCLRSLGTPSAWTAVETASFRLECEEIAALIELRRDHGGEPPAQIRVGLETALRELERSLPPSSS